MSRKVEAVLWVATLLVTAVPAGAWANAAHPDAYEFQLYKLGTAADIALLDSPLPDGTPERARFAASNDAFRSFARQLAAAMTSVTLSPPDTLGHSAFAVTAELSVVNFVSSGPTTALPTVGQFSGPLLIPSVHFRKGLPSSFELGGRAAWIEKSRMGIGTLELKWALNEGFAYLPDIAVRGNISKLINSRDFDLTAGGLDIGVGKQFAIAGMITLTPYVGWNLLFVGASSSTVDFNPQRTLSESDAPQLQYSKFYAFEPVQAGANSHNRFYAGFRFIGGVFTLGGEVSYSVIGRFQNEQTKAFTDVPSVLAWNMTLGLDF